MNSTDINSMSDMSLGEFSAALAAKISVPGGGGASALAAALGAALGTMVGNYTIGKKKYAAVEADILALMAETERLRTELLGLIDADAAAFEPLSRAYAIPKDEPGRDETMEKCLRDAAAVPLEMMRLCCRVIELQRELAEKGSVLMTSDAGTGAALCCGALYGAALNVKVNTASMKNREYADGVNAEVDEMLSKYFDLTEKIYRDVMGRYS